MRSAPYQEVLAVTTDSPDDDLLVVPLTEGLINHTYLVTIRSTGDRFILQQINHNVFPEPGKLTDNYERIWQQLNLTQIKIPEPLPFTDGFLFIDSSRRYWRKFSYVDNAITIHSTDNVQQAGKVAETFAAITAAFEDHPIGTIQPTLKGFHDLSARYKQLQHAISMKDPERLLKAAALVNELKKREHYVSFYEVITTSTEFKSRLMHHDAKISNILFDEETGQVICPVDFDTCMPGYFFSDIGDMIRSMACSDTETAQPGNLHIRKELYESIVSRYLSVLGPSLSHAEKKYIHSSGLLITYMQALRFITDYLDGDQYYHTSYAGQNFDRAENQLTLLQQLEIFLRQEYSFTV